MPAFPYSNWVYGAIVLIVLSGAAYGGWKLRDYQALEDELAAKAAAEKAMTEALAARDLEEDRLKGVASSLEKKLADLRANKAKIQYIKVKEYAKPVYTDCPVPDSGMQFLRDAAAEVAAARAAR